ncbi:MAG: sigma-70 family RNA polymerase sigma factor [Blastocatellia bacterium]
MTAQPHEVTAWLLAWSKGDETALAHLAPLVEAELHRLAQTFLRQEQPNHTLQPTALVNEAYLRLIDWKAVHWQNRAHFIGVAAQMMRRILVDHARRRQQQKHGGDAVRVSLAEAAHLSDERAPDLVALDEALQALAAFAPRQSRVVELRFFGGLNVEETAAALNVSPRTVQNDWSAAQAWLHRELVRQ